MITKCREHFSKVRQCQKCKNEEIRIDCVQPGMFMGTKYLMIAQNPAYPKPDILKSDAILLDKNSDDGDFHSAYKKSQLLWKFYNNFIKKIIGDSYDFSIINIVRCPTKMNASPSCEMIESCNEHLIKSIELIKPEFIICVGHLAQVEVRALGLDKKYKCIFSKHYAYLLRQSQEYYESEINKIKEQLK